MDDPNQIWEMFLIKPKLLTSSLEVFDFNILPVRYQRRKIRLVGPSPMDVVLDFYLSQLHPSFFIGPGNPNRLQSDQN